MNTPPITVRSGRARPVRLGAWPWILAFVLVLFYGSAVLMVVGVVSLFRVGADTQTVRESLREGLGGKLDKRLELRAGCLPFALARLGSGFLELDPEVREVLGGVRGVEVGMYTARDEGFDLGRAIWASDARLRERGWERVVYAQERTEAIAVYVRFEGARKEDAHLCGVVGSGRDLIVTTLRTDLNDLLAVAQGKKWTELF